MKTYLVGGAVRDAQLGIPIKEKDWVVVGSTPKEMINLGYRPVGSNFPVFLHPDTKEEYALARTERKTGTGHKGFTFHTDSNVTLEEDLKRRDLTINAIAQTENGDLIDPYGGLEDIKKKVLKKVSDAFKEDPLRVLRVARLAAKLRYLGFSVEEETMDTMISISNSGELKTLPKERIWQETYKALGERNPEKYFKVLIDSHAFYELTGNVGVDSWGMFEEIAPRILEPDLRWAYFGGYTLDNLDKIFGVPKKIQELTNVYRKLRLFNPSDKSEVESHEVLNFIEEVDGLRRNKRFNKALKIFYAMDYFFSSKKETLIPWDTLIKTLLTIKPSSSKLKGKGISEDIRLQRLKIIDLKLKNG
tara:strand:- start:559 stop:1641 length:1083 start_codon:yes stop_codon:yes gene_type:complete